jgi:hypothetical protein
LLLTVAITPLFADEVSNPPPREVVVAAPRAALMAQPRLTGNLAGLPTNRPAGCAVMGATFNFPSPGIQVVVHQDRPLLIRLGPNAEGVWYDGACGKIGMLLALEQFNPDTGAWDPVGRDGVFDHRVGPSLGFARRVGVPLHLATPGAYDLRALVQTYALPGCPDQSVVTPRGCGDVSINTVRIHVVVVEDPPAEEPPVDETPAEEELPDVLD